MSVEITGLEDVQRKLHKLDRDMKGRALEMGLGAAAKLAEGFVKTNAREEFYTGRPRGQTGNLLNSIASQARDKEAVVYVGAEYGVYLEMGTSRGIQARHYVKRGVLEHIPAIGAAFVQTMKRILGT